MAWDTCSYCEQLIQGHCGRCSKAFCTTHARDHWVHDEPAVEGPLKQQLEDILSEIDLALETEASASSDPVAPTTANPDEGN
jgi:hypothetical protein